MTAHQRLKRDLERALIAKEQTEQLLEDKTRKLYLAYEKLMKKNGELSRISQKDKILLSILEMERKQASTNSIILNYINIIADNCKGFISGKFFYVLDAKISGQIDGHVQQDNLDQYQPCHITEDIRNMVIECFHCAHEIKLEQQNNIGHITFYPVFFYDKVIGILLIQSVNPLNDHAIEILKTSTSMLGATIKQRREEKKKEQHFTVLQKTIDELKNTQSQLVQSSKLASIGQLATGVAHEINNFIGFVSNNQNVLTEHIKILHNYIQLQQQTLQTHLDIEKLEKVHSFEKQHQIDCILENLDELIEDNTSGIDRVKDIILGLKTFSRVDEVKTELININECIDSALKIIWYELKYHCEVVKDYQELPLIEVNQGEISQVFINLLINASQAIEGNGTISIATHHKNKSINISISGTGSGIKPEHMALLFDPFLQQSHRVKALVLAYL